MRGSINYFYGLWALLLMVFSWVCCDAISHQPKIMVIPFVKESEDIRTILEEDPNKRLILTKIKDSFDARGIATIDFLAKIKSLSIQEGMCEEHLSDLKSLIVENSGADVYIDAEMIIERSSSGNSVKVIVTGYEISTGKTLGNKVGESGKFYTEDFGKLGVRAIESCASDFLQSIQKNFEDFIENGRSITMTIGIEESAGVDMHSEIGDEMLTIADLIDLWLEENAYKGNYHVQGTTSKKMIVDDLRIPLYDEAGKKYSIASFGREFLKFARKYDLSIKRDIVQQSLLITIK